MLLTHRLDLQLDRLRQGLLGGRLGRGLCLGGARGPQALTGPWSRGPLLAVGNVGLLSGLDLGACLGVHCWLEERSWNGHASGEGETRIHLEPRERHRRRDHIGGGREPCRGTNQEKNTVSKSFLTL